MIDLYLRAADEAALIAALPMLRQNGEWVTASHKHALAVRGTIYTRPVSIEEIPIAKEGYHADLRLFGEGEAWYHVIPQEMIVYPKTPDFKWAS